MMRGRFVTFEGIEGAGKSTLIAVIAEAMIGAGREVLTTFEPGATPLGCRLRAILLQESQPVALAELLLYLADRAEHVEREIAPALASGRWVLCDRYTDATIAYQGYGRGLDMAAVESACALAEGVKPDQTFLLDLDPECGLRRVADRGGLDRMESESLAFHRRVRQGYLDLAAASPERFTVIDAAQSPTVVQRIVLEALDLA